jgi:hypothetical protein
MQRQVRRVPRAFVALALAAGVLMLATTARPASACSCATTRGDDAGAFDRADAVFSGVLTEVRTPSGERAISSDPERFIFDVDRVYKGEVFARQSVVTARGGASCGLEVSPGVGAILVYARSRTDGRVVADEGEVVADLCGGTRYFIDPVPASFGGGTLPLPGSSPIGGAPGSSPIGGAPAGRAPSGWSTTTWLAVLVGGTLAVSLGARMLMRRRS